MGIFDSLDGDFDSKNTGHTGRLKKQIIVQILSQQWKKTFFFFKISFKVSAVVSVIIFF